MWLWREWVIKAFNANMPFDEFTIEQLAGDLLPNATIDQQIATGFHRNVMTSDEGGLIDAEYLQPLRRRSRQHDRRHVARPDGRLRAVPRPQIRPAHAARFLPGLCLLPQRARERQGRRARRQSEAVPARADAGADEQELARLDGDIAAATEAGAGTRARRSTRGRPSGKSRSPRAGSATEPEGPWVKFPLDADGSGTSDDGQRSTGEARRARGLSSRARSDKASASRKKAGSNTATSSASRRISHSPRRVAAPEAAGRLAFGKMEASAANCADGISNSTARKPSFHLIHQWPSERDPRAGRSAICRPTRSCISPSPTTARARPRA